MDTVANALDLSLFFGEDKVLKHQGLEHSWKNLETKLASGYPALFYGRIPYLPIMQLLVCRSNLAVCGHMARYRSCCTAGLAFVLQCCSSH